MSKKFTFFLITFIVGVGIGFAFGSDFLREDMLGQKKYIQEKKGLSDFSVTEWINQAKDLELQISTWKELRTLFSDNNLAKLGNKEKTSLLILLRGFTRKAQGQQQIVNKEAAEGVIKVLKSIFYDAGEADSCRLILVGMFNSLSFTSDEVIEILRRKTDDLPKAIQPAMLEMRILAGDKIALAEMLENVVNDPDYKRCKLLARQLVTRMVSPALKEKANIPTNLDDKALLEFASWLRKNPVTVHHHKLGEEFSRTTFDWP